MDYAITVSDWRKRHGALLAIRHAVFVEEQGVPIELEHDRYDREALHLIATAADGTPIATARMLADGHIGRIAVLSDWRGRGIGTSLLVALQKIAAQRGLDEVYLHAQCSAEAFYRRLGFVADGEVFVDAGLDHRTMRRRVDAPAAG